MCLKNMYVYVCRSLKITLKVWRACAGEELKSSGGFLPYSERSHNKKKETQTKNKSDHSYHTSGQIRKYWEWG